MVRKRNKEAALTGGQIKKASELFEAVDPLEVGQFARHLVEDPAKRPAIKREAQKLDQSGLTLTRQQWIGRVACMFLGGTGLAAALDPAIQSVINSEVGIAALAVAVVSALSAESKS